MIGRVQQRLISAARRAFDAHAHQQPEAEAK
jgi:hypothetical protein